MTGTVTTASLSPVIFLDLTMFDISDPDARSHILSASELLLMHMTGKVTEYNSDKEKPDHSVRISEYLFR